MNRDDAVKKIRKCIALAASATGSEAAAAMRQAQALMREHGLDEKGVEQATVREVEAKAQFIPILGWEAELVRVVADAFGCYVFSTSRLVHKPGGELGRARYWKFIGVDATPEIAAYAFEVLATQCVKARRAHITKQSKNCKPATKAARGDAFAAAWVRAARELVERFANGAKNEALVKAYVAKKYPDLGQANVKHRDQRGNVKDSAQHGWSAGERATLNHGVGSLQQRQLIGFGAGQ